MSFRAPKREKCEVCGKTVYDMEKMAADGKVFHKGCMKCEECGKSLSLGNYAALSGKYYCKPHFKQLFQLKGNYSEGFGEEKPTAKWTNKEGGGSPVISAAASAPQEPDQLAPSNVVKSGTQREDASAVVAGGSQSPSVARQKFKEMSSSGESSPPVAKASGGAPKSPFNVRRDKCEVCGKTVYEMEKMAADGKVFHKGCMKCEECGKSLTLGNYAALSGKYYCKPHFKQLFQLKGNYSEGFGEEKPTAKWTNKDGAATPEVVVSSEDAPEEAAAAEAPAEEAVAEEAPAEEAPAEEAAAEEATAEEEPAAEGE